MSKAPARPERWALGAGTVLAVIQIWLALALAPGRTVLEAYSNLCTWDCLWYEEIARDGYHSTVPPVRQNRQVSNVAFFPAYPYAVRALYMGFGLPPRIGLLVVSQTFCALFWAGLLLWLKKWKIPGALSALVVLAIFAHPAAPFLALGYSESLFLCGLIFLIVNSCGARAKGWAAVAGFAMSASRIIGLAASAFPVLQHLTRRLSGRRDGSLLRPALITAGAASGALAFLIYCQLRFGRYDLYMLTQKIGWNVSPDPAAILKWRSFRFLFGIDKVATYASLAAFALLGILEIALALLRARTSFHRRLPVYATALSVFLVTLSGLKSVEFMSMVRYTLPWTVLLLVCAAHLAVQFPRPPRWLGIAACVGIFGGMVYLFHEVQLPHVRDFLHGQWFA